MAGGGMRLGSGRPPQLKHAHERLWCYAEYFSVREEWLREKERTYWAQFENHSDLQELRAKLNSIPLARRTLRDGEADDSEAAKLVHDINEEIGDVGAQARGMTRGRSCRRSPRCHQLPRFRGARRRVFDEVARRASEKFGREISATEIETNWKFMQAQLTS